MRLCRIIVYPPAKTWQSPLQCVKHAFRIENTKIVTFLTRKTNIFT